MWSISTTFPCPVECLAFSGVCRRMVLAMIGARHVACHVVHALAFRRFAFFLQSVFVRSLCCVQGQPCASLRAAQSPSVPVVHHDPSSQPQRRLAASSRQVPLLRRESEPQGTNDDAGRCTWLRRRRRVLETVGTAARRPTTTRHSPRPAPFLWRMGVGGGWVGWPKSPRRRSV